MPINMNMGTTPMADDRPIVSPRLQLTEIVSGEMFTRLVKAFGDISADKDNKKEISENCEEIKRVLRADFGIETTVCVLSPVDQIGFFGFNVYPNPKDAKAIIDALINNNPHAIKSIWQHIIRWHLEIDGRFFYDMNKITPSEMAALLLYNIESVVFDYQTPLDTAMAIINYRNKMDYLTTFITESERLRNIFIIPFLIGCADTNYVFANPKKLETLNRESIISTTPQIKKSYMSGVKKILDYYGKMEIIDRSVFTRKKKVEAILYWIYEGLNDLRYSSLRMKVNLQRHMIACRSPLIRMIFKQMIFNISDVQGKLSNQRNAAEESTVVMNPELQKLEESIETGYWKNYIATMESKASDDMFDSSGNVKKVSQEDLDRIYVEIDNISSTDDKIYLLERLYKYISIIDYSLDILEDKKLSKRVKVSKDKLLRMEKFAYDTKERILNYRIAPEEYGLYIKYPSGYDG